MVMVMVIGIWDVGERCASSASRTLQKWLIPIELHLQSQREEAAKKYGMCTVTIVRRGNLAGSSRE